MKRKVPRGVDKGFELRSLRTSMETNATANNKYQKDRVKKMSIKELLAYVHVMDRDTFENRWIAAGGKI